MKHERLLRTFGHAQDSKEQPACGHCVDQKKLFDEIKKTNPKIKIEEYDIYRDSKGKEYIEKKKVKAMPTTFDCPLDENGNMIEKDCVEIQGFNEKYFKKYLKR
jgi:glutaredoxin